MHGISNIRMMALCTGVHIQTAEVRGADRVEEFPPAVILIRKL